MLWSFETFATLMAQITVAICSVILYVFLAAKLLPNWLLKPHVDPSLDGDRGIKRFVFDCGRAIVYEPSVAYRKYIKQYILSAVGKERYIQCKFAKSVHCAEYDVVAFDSSDRAIDTVCVQEHFFEKNGNVSRAEALSEKTAYVKIVVRSVNGIHLDSETVFVLPASRVFFFMLSVTAAMILEMMYLRSVLVYVAELLFEYSRFTTGYGDLFAMVSAFCGGLILSLLLFNLYKTNEKQKLKRKRK